MTDLQTISSYSGLFGVILAAIGFTTYLIGMDGRIGDLEEQVKKFKDSTMSKFVEREWCEVKNLRNLDEPYQNDTGLPIELAVSVGPYEKEYQCRLVISIKGAPVLYQSDENTFGAKYCAAALTIPPGAQYKVDLASPSGKSQFIASWWELKPSCDQTIDSA